MQVPHRVVMGLSAQVQRPTNQQNSVKDIVQLSQIQIIAISEAFQQVHHIN